MPIPNSVQHASATPSPSPSSFMIRFNDQFQRVHIEPDCAELDELMQLPIYAPLHDPRHGYQIARRRAPCWRITTALPMRASLRSSSIVLR